MNKSIRKFKQEYNGKCTLIPCSDLPKFGEDSFWDMKDEILDYVINQNMICDWKIKDEYLNVDLDDEEEKEEFWNDTVCKVMEDGFLVIYEHRVPSHIVKENGRFSSCTLGGWTRTEYIHLKDISQLSSVLSNIDDDIIEEVWKEEQAKKEQENA